MEISETLKVTARNATASCTIGAAIVILLGPLAHAQAGLVPEVRSPLIHGMHWIALILEICGVATIAAGAIGSTAVFFLRQRGEGWITLIREYRANLGRGILLGLEFLIAADIIGTVAVTPTFQSLGVLAAIIVIRTFLSFSLQIEIDGQLPWKRREEPTPGE